MRMTLTDYCSDYLKDLYSMSNGFDCEYKEKYHYSVQDNDSINEINDYLSTQFVPESGLKVDEGGFVIDFNKMDTKGYVVMQTLYNGNDVKELGDVLCELSKYTHKVYANGGEDFLVIGTYGEMDSSLYTFDVAFFVPKRIISYDHKY